MVVDTAFWMSITTGCVALSSIRRISIRSIGASSRSTAIIIGRIADGLVYIIWLKGKDSALAFDRSIQLKNPSGAGCSPILSPSGSLAKISNRTIS